MTSDSDSLMNQARMIQLAVIILMAMLFIVVGYLAPAMFVGAISEERHMEVHQFTAQDAGMNDTEHFVCFDRTVHSNSGMAGHVYYELFTYADDGTRYEVASSEENRFFSPGRQAIITSIPLSDELPEAEYQYSVTIEMSMADGRVTRQFNYVSEPFTIQENYSRGNLQEFSQTCGISD